MSYCRGIFALIWGIIVFNGAHVGVYVARGVEHVVDEYMSGGKIYHGKHHGHVCITGYPQESRVPFCCAAARAFRGDGDAEFLAILETSGQFLYERGSSRPAVDRHTSDFAEKKSERPEKPAFFHQETCRTAYTPYGKFSEKEVYIARMRSHAYDAAWQIGHVNAHLPAHEPEDVCG